MDNVEIRKNMLNEQLKNLFEIKWVKIKAIWWLKAKKNLLYISVVKKVHVNYIASTHFPLFL